MADQGRVLKWLDIVAEDLSVADDLYKTGHWLYVGFMCHQVVEKSIKAYWCACRDDDPPFLHNHERIAKGCGLYTKMSEDQKDFLEGIKQLNIEARYQDTKNAVARSLNSENTANILQQTKQLHTWIMHELKTKMSIQ